MQHASRRLWSWLISDVGRGNFPKYLMKPIAIALLISVQLMHAEPFELSGILSSQERGTLIVLTDQKDSTTSSWLSQGRSWRGYRVEKIDIAQNTVVLKKGEQSVTLRIADARVQSGDISPSEPGRLLRGELTRKGDRLIYSPDAVIEMGPYKVRARAGRMEAEGAWVVGELVVENATGATLRAASVGTNNGKVRISAKKVSLPSPPPDFGRSARK